MSKIYEPSGKAREYSPLALNYFRGCTHGCKYCYVPKMMCRFNGSYNHMDCHSSLNLSELEASCRKYRCTNKRVLLSFTSDPYCGVSQTDTRKVLQMLDFYDIPVAVLTKGGSRLLSDVEILKKMKDVRVGVSLTFSNDADSLEWEPGAALPDDRLSTLEKLHKEGITTWASFEPVIKPEQTLVLLEKATPYLDYVKVGKLNHFPKIEKNIDWSDFLTKVIKHCELSNLNYYIKNDLAEAAPQVKVKEAARIADNFS